VNTKPLIADQADDTSSQLCLVLLGSRGVLEETQK